MDTLSAKQIRDYLLKLGVNAVGIAPAGPVKNKDRFLKRIAKGFPPYLDYLNKHQDKRFDLDKLAPNARSVITIGLNYNPPKSEFSQNAKYKVAKYAWGEDYHNILRSKLKKLRTFLKTIVPELEGRICVDTAPFMDVYWAEQAGIGWQGKQTLLISKDFGTRLMLGSLVINQAVDKYDRPEPNHCGTCTLCVDSCPTAAIEWPYYLEASKCISYWTIESKDEMIPDNISKDQNGYIFGCDICSDICPYNKKNIPKNEIGFAKLEAVQLLETGEVAKIASEDFKKYFPKSPINRPGLKGIIRNIKSSEKS